MRKSRRRNSPEIELTPLIDVLFILIIFFVLTTSFIKSQVEVDLPKGQGEPLSGKTAVISVTAEGEYSIEGKEASVEDILSYASRSEQEGRNIVIVGDRRSHYGAIASLLDYLRIRGVSSVGLALEGGSSP